MSLTISLFIACHSILLIKYAQKSLCPAHPRPLCQPWQIYCHLKVTLDWYGTPYLNEFNVGTLGSTDPINIVCFFSFNHQEVHSRLSVIQMAWTPATDSVAGHGFSPSPLVNHYHSCHCPDCGMDWKYGCKKQGENFSWGMLYDAVTREPDYSPYPILTIVGK